MESNDQDTSIPVPSEELIHCSISKWYPTFKKVTIPTEFVQLPDDFVQFITNDTLYANEESKCFDEWDDSDSEHWPIEEDIENEDEKPYKQAINTHLFPTIENPLKEAISKWGGVFPKLNWSSPKDVHWMTLDGTLKCTSMENLVLLLKSSDYIRSDILKVEQINNNDPNAINITLALRKWHDMKLPYMFRCYVKNNRFIGISQLHIIDCWEFLAKEKDDHKLKIDQFYRDHIRGKFPLESYAFDVYIHSNGNVYLVDFAPLRPECVNPLLYTWEELNSFENDDPLIRVVDENYGIQPNFQRMLSNLPYEFANFEDYACETVNTTDGQSMTLKELAAFFPK